MTFAKVKKHILQHGFICLSDYMRLCLSDAEGGYYPSRCGIGAKGDFITAPEVSQLFGEMIAIWLYHTWQSHGTPLPLHLIELGPGRGTLMADILLTLRQLSPSLPAQLQVHLVEISPLLQQRQQTKVQGLASCQWHYSIADLINALPAQGCYIIGNEFFDALPCRHYQYLKDTWHKRVITLDPQYGHLGWDTIPEEPEFTFLDCYPSPQEGDILEINPDTLQLCHYLFHHISKGKNAGLFIDYGYESFIYGDSLQAISRHQFINPLAKPGECDLTTHVQFGALKAIAQEYGLKRTLTTQRHFLSTYGIDLRLQQLLRNNPQKAEAILAGFNRLTHPNEMGSLFKVLCVTR